MCSSGSSTMESPGDETGRGAAPLTTALPNGSNKIIGRNVNGTSKSHQLAFCFIFQVQPTDGPEFVFLVAFAFLLAIVFINVFFSTSVFSSTRWVHF